MADIPPKLGETPPAASPSASYEDAAFRRIDSCGCPLRCVASPEEVERSAFPAWFLGVAVEGYEGLAASGTAEELAPDLRYQERGL